MMLKLIKSNSYLLRFYNHNLFPTCTRTFLSESYSCTEAWNRRFESPLLSKVNPSNLSLELKQNCQSTGKISAVDVDILVNTIKDPDSADEVANILHLLRLSAETTKTLESTHHAVIRYLLESNNEEWLLDVLHDRLNYGIFPDHYCYNLMMNDFIQKKNYASAAKVAVLLMLQEDSENILSNAFGMYSCYKYLENPESWTLKTETIENPDEEIIKVRVRYLNNAYFDDHFHLREPKHLVGKSLVFFGQSLNDPLGRTCQLRGYVLWSKYEHAVDAIKNWIDQGIDKIVYQEVIPLIDSELSKIPEDQVTNHINELKAQLQKLQNLHLEDGSAIDEMEKRLSEAVKLQEANEIRKQCQIYEKWLEIRMDSLTKQREELDRIKRIENIEKMKNELQKRERLLNFFDNEEEIELNIEKKLELENEKYGPPITVPTDIEDNYIPPEVAARRPA